MGVSVDKFVSFLRDRIKKHYATGGFTNVLLVMLALGGYALLWGAGQVLGAAVQTVSHPIHLVQGLKPGHKRNVSKFTSGL